MATNSSGLRTISTPDLAQRIKTEAEQAKAYVEGRGTPVSTITSTSLRPAIGGGLTTSQTSVSTAQLGTTLFPGAKFTGSQVLDLLGTRPDLLRSLSSQDKARNFEELRKLVGSGAVARALERQGVVALPEYAASINAPSVRREETKRVLEEFGGERLLATETKDFPKKTEQVLREALEKKQAIPKVIPMSIEQSVLPKETKAFKLQSLKPQEEASPTIKRFGLEFAPTSDLIKRKIAEQNRQAENLLIEATALRRAAVSLFPVYEIERQRFENDLKNLGKLVDRFNSLQNENKKIETANRLNSELKKIEKRRQELEKQRLKIVSLLVKERNLVGYSSFDRELGTVPKSRPSGFLGLPEDIQQSVLSGPSASLKNSNVLEEVKRYKETGVESRLSKLPSLVGGDNISKAIEKGGIGNIREAQEFVIGVRSSIPEIAFFGGLGLATGGLGSAVVIGTEVLVGSGLAEIGGRTVEEAGGPRIAGELGGFLIGAGGTRKALLGLEKIFPTEVAFETRKSSVKVLRVGEDLTVSQAKPLTELKIKSLFGTKRAVSSSNLSIQESISRAETLEPIELGLREKFGVFDEGISYRASITKRGIEEEIASKFFEPKISRVLGKAKIVESPSRTSRISTTRVPVAKGGKVRKVELGVSNLTQITGEEFASREAKDLTVFVGKRTQKVVSFTGKFNTGEAGEIVSTFRFAGSKGIVKSELRGLTFVDETGRVFKIKGVSESQVRFPKEKAATKPFTSIGKSQRDLTTKQVQAQLNKQLGKSETAVQESLSVAVQEAKASKPIASTFKAVGGTTTIARQTQKRAFQPQTQSFKPQSQRTSSGLKIVSAQIQKVGDKSVQRVSSVSATAEVSKATQRELQKLGFRTTSLQKTKTSQKSILGEAQLSSSVILSREAERQAELQRVGKISLSKQKLSGDFPTVPKVVIVPPITEKTGILPSMDFKLPKPQSIPPQQGYDVLVRTKGRRIKGKFQPGQLAKITKQPLPKTSATALLHTVVDNTIAQSGRIVKTTKKADKALSLNPMPYKFRANKRNPLIQTEKRMFAIDTKGEKQELTVARYLQRQNNPILKRSIGKRKRRKR